MNKKDFWQAVDHIENINVKGIVFLVFKHKKQRYTATIVRIE